MLMMSVFYLEIVELTSELKKSRLAESQKKASGRVIKYFTVSKRVEKCPLTKIRSL